MLLPIMLVQHVLVINRLATEVTFDASDFFMYLLHMKVDCVVVPKFLLANMTLSFLVVRVVNLPNMLVEALGAFELLIARRALLDFWRLGLV